MFYILRRYYWWFWLFFDEPDLPFHAHDQFITEILSNFECKIYSKKEIIQFKGEPADYIHFISKGCVRAYTDVVKNEDGVQRSSEDFFLFELSEMSWFGDYQTLTNSNSNLNFISGEDGTVLYQVKGKRFWAICKKYTGHQCFYLERALARRRYWKRLQIIKEKNPPLCEKS